MPQPDLRTSEDRTLIDSLTGYLQTKNPEVGIAGFVCSFFAPPLGLILSIIGLRTAARRGMAKSLSVAGTVIGAVGTTAAVALVVLFYVGSAPSPLHKWVDTPRSSATARSPAQALAAAASGPVARPCSTPSASTATQAATQNGPTSAAQLVQPAQAEVVAVMARTVEVATPTEHFVPVPGAKLTVADGFGGSLTAVVGQRFPTAGAYGQLVFLWHNDRFLGWDSAYESVKILGLHSPAAGEVEVAYAHYAANDPACSPSLSPVRVIYRWTGRRLIANARPPYPSSPARPLEVKLLP
jgi:hypothetical protein